MIEGPARFAIDDLLWDEPAFMVSLPNGVEIGYATRRRLCRAPNKPGLDQPAGKDMDISDQVHGYVVKLQLVCSDKRSWQLDG